MGTKAGLAIGLGIGFVLGSRAGRERYEQIREAAGRIWRSPLFAGPVADTAQRAADLAREAGARATDRAAEAVKQRLFGTQGQDQGGDSYAGSAARPIHIHVEEAGSGR